jgi:Na+(H+)/acetate symporter ActP
MHTKFSTKRTATTAAIQSFDILGAIICTGGLVCFTVARFQAAAVGWSQVYIYILLIIGVMFMAGFCFVEVYFVSFPLFPLHILSIDVSLILVRIACGWASFGIWNYYPWQFLLLVWKAPLPPQGTAQCSPPSVLGVIIVLKPGCLLS